MKKKKHFNRLKELYTKHDGNITEATKLLCKETGEKFTDSVRRLASVWLSNEGVTYKKNQAKILIFDLETAPLKAFVWRLWKQNVHPLNGQLIEDWFMLTWSAKWLFDDKIYSGKLTSKEARTQDDKRIMKSLWKMIDEADIIIAHNADKFDVKRMNTRFLVHDMVPPSPYQVIDTLKHAKKQFDMTSNKLDFLAFKLGVQTKHSTDFSLWERCYAGEKKALNEMSEYNDQDCIVLEEVYLKMRAWIKPHPNVALFIDTDDEACACCGSQDLKYVGNYTTTVNSFDALRCNECGSVSRRRKSNMSIKDRTKILSSSPK